MLPSPHYSNQAYGPPNYGIAVHSQTAHKMYPLLRKNPCRPKIRNSWLVLLSPILPGIPPVPVHRLPTVHLDSNPVSDNCSIRNDLPVIPLLFYYHLCNISYSSQSSLSDNLSCYLPAHRSMLMLTLAKPTPEFLF